MILNSNGKILVANYLCQYYLFTYYFRGIIGILKRDTQDHSKRIEDITHYILQ